MNKTSRNHKLLVMFAATVVLLLAATAHASANIPIDSPFYTNLDVLISESLIKSSISSTRPFTRS
ncbi:MAG: hypothetical protein U9Q84_05455, partial [Thermodesulfobacteriota bacterium]|nr:hypothetical protein [Thermodesulfobacteriota bacterium]